METIKYLKVVQEYQIDPSGLNSAQQLVLQRALNKYGDGFVKDYDVSSVLERLYNQTAPFSYVEFPILGLKYHVNDIGIISGWVFVLIMLASYLSLKKQHDNLLYMIDEFENNKDYLKTALMDSIWTSSDNSSWILKVLRLVYILPFVIMLLILFNDWLSKDLGYMISPINMSFLFTSSIISIAIIFFLSVNHIKVLKKMDALWDSV